MTSSPHGGDDHDAAALITDTEEAANAWMQGDMDRYLALIHHARGFTLTPPNGGPPQQFADRRKEFEGWQSPFSDGEAALEITAAHAWGDTAVLVMIERQHGRIADLPDQDLSMRVTQIYRWTPSGWEMVHRHADPLTRPLSDEQLRSLAGGEAHRASDPPERLRDVARGLSRGRRGQPAVRHVQSTSGRGIGPLGAEGGLSP